MSQIPVILPSGASNSIKVAILADETGTTNMQIVQLGFPDQGEKIINLLANILNELQAQRLQDAQATNTPFEPTPNLIETINQ